MATKSFFLLPVTEEAENVLTLLAVDLKKGKKLTSFSRFSKYQIMIKTARCAPKNRENVEVFFFHKIKILKENTIILPNGLG